MTKVLAVLATLVLALLGAQVARADADFTDPTGDANGAPDVTNVSVFNDSANRVVFLAKIAGGKAMAADSEIDFVVNSDNNPDTGTNGWDYLIFLAGDKSAGLLKWDGTQWVDSPATTAKVYVFDDVVYFGIDRAELGNPSSFDFYVESIKVAGDQIVASDAAPDGDAVWTYATVTKTFGLFSSPIVPVTKGGARAGKPFIAAYLFGRTDSPEPASGPKTTCTATLGTKRIPARVAQDVEVATCRVTVPKTMAAKTTVGKLLKLTLKTTAGGKTVTKSYSTKIKK